MKSLLQQLALPLLVPGGKTIDLSKYRQILQHKYDGDLSCIETTQAYATAVTEGFETLPFCVQDTIRNYFKHVPALNDWNSQVKSNNTNSIIAAIRQGFKTLAEIAKATELCLATVKSRIQDLLTSQAVCRKKVGYSFVYTVAYQKQNMVTA